MAKGIMANSILNAAAGMLLLVTGFASSIIAARLLGPEANGIIAFSLWFATTGSLVAELGTGIILLRMLPQLKAQGYSPERRRGFAALLITPTLISTAILAVIYGVIFLGSEELHWAKTAPSVALVTGILFVIQSVGAYTKNYLIGEQRLSSFFRLTIIASVFQFGIVFVGTLYFGVAGALVGYTAGQFVMFLYTGTILFRKRDNCDVPMSYLVSSSLILTAEFIIDSIFLNRIEILFIQQFWSVGLVGYYAVSLSLANLALQLPIQLTGSLLPYYAERRHDTENGGLSQEVFSGVIRALSYITLPMSFGLAAISTSLVTTVFGEAFRPAGMMVALLSLSSPAFVLMQILTQYLFSIDKAKSRLITGIIGAVVIVTGCLAVVPWFGGEGAALVRIGAFSLMCVLMIGETGFGKSLSHLYATLVKVTIASLAVATVAYTINHLFPGAVGLIVAVSAGMAVYPVALRYLRAIPGEDAAVLLQISKALPAKLQSSYRKFVVFTAPLAADEAMAVETEISQSASIPAGAGRQAALPVTIGDLPGLFMPEDGGVEQREAAVLLVAPWGFEELCTRKFYRILAEQMAGIGIPSLRFDYPGTGDAPDTATITGLNSWENAVLSAAAQLRRLSNRSRIIIIAQGLGAAIVQSLAARLDGAAAVVVLAPVTNGRGYLREVALMSKVIDQGLGLRDDQRESEGVSIAGFVMPETVAADIRKLNMSTPSTLVSSHYLILERSQRIADTTFADGLRALGAEVSVELFEGYDALVSNPTIQKMPMESITKITNWLLANNPVASEQVAPALDIVPSPIHGDGYSEFATRFGSGNHLYGTLCAPAGRPTDAAVLLLTTAYDRNAGWGRSTVNTARALARLGIASLRYDSANVGDSAPIKAVPSQVLYSDSQKADVTAALDVMEKAFNSDLMIAGRCSGGYLALRAAVDDPRLKAVVSINPFVFYWDPAKSVDDGLRFVPRSLQDYSNRLVRVDTLKRLASGEINLLSAARNIVIAFGKQLSRVFAPLLRALRPESSVGLEVRRTFRSFEIRNVPVSLIYSEGDVGLHDLTLHFGDRGTGLSAYRNVRLKMLPDTDHNITPASSRQTVFEEIIRLACVHKNALPDVKKTQTGDDAPFRTLAAEQI